MNRLLEGNLKFESIHMYVRRSLIRLVEQFGLRRWSYIAQRLTGRIGKQCRERWHNHLRPNIKVFHFYLFWDLVVWNHLKSISDRQTYIQIQ